MELSVSKIPVIKATKDIQWKEVMRTLQIFLNMALISALICKEPYDLLLRNAVVQLGNASALFLRLSWDSYGHSFVGTLLFHCPELPPALPKEIPPRFHCLHLRSQARADH